MSAPGHALNDCLGSGPDHPHRAPAVAYAPIAVLRCSHAEWRGSTLTRPSRRRQQTVGSAEKRTFAPDFTRPK